MATLHERAAATEAVLKRFRNKPLDFRHGWDCLHMLRLQLLKLGHKPPRIPRYYSMHGALRAMERAGFADLAAVVDSVLPERIAPAAMLVGDIGLLPGEPFGALVLAVGGKVIGWHDADLSKMAVIADVPRDAFLAAWRV